MQGREDGSFTAFLTSGPHWILGGRQVSWLLVTDKGTQGSGLSAVICCGGDTRGQNPESCLYLYTLEFT